ncbi:MAG: stage II sporulation protein D [Firmicutes bacterium]|nr:stage II sporulation protein D [Bacillota bacterium]
MKRLLLTYVGCIIVALSLPVLIGMGRFSDDSSNYVVDSSSILPKNIDIFFTEVKDTNTIDFEEYLKGVVVAEMPASFEKEALKAQAVAARTYAYHKLKQFSDSPSSAPAEHPNAAICTNPMHCTAYCSYDFLLQKHGLEWMNKNYEKISSCVDETAGEIMVYDEQPILAVFHSASAGGHTQASGDVWERDVPYLKSVQTGGEEQKADYITSVCIKHEDFTKKIIEEFDNAKFPDDFSKWIGAAAKTDGNYIKSIEVGGVCIDGAKMRTLFDLKSTYFNMSIDDKNVIFEVEGYGHGVGLSQYGANYMAKCGADYKTILENYYDGAALKKY